MNDSEVQRLLCGAVLVMIRLSCLMVFAPIFSSAAIASRIKAGFAGAMTLLMAPVVATVKGTVLEISVKTVLSEMAVGAVFGLSLMLLAEMVTFAGALLSMEFSFSLVNLMDPNSKVETQVMGQFLGWVNTLVLLGAGLHRTVLRAVLRSFAVVPVGSFVVSQRTSAEMMHLAAGIFLAGVQLASPVIAAAFVVEVTVGLVGRLAPQLHSTVLGVPFKTLSSYVVLLASLAMWPRFLEVHFEALMSAAERMVAAG